MNKRAFFKTIVKWLICAGFVLVLFPYQAIVLKAEGPYVASDIATSGAKSEIGRYASFEEAKTAIATYPNGIVTHEASKSPSKIIAMTRGVAISYTFRYAGSSAGQVAKTMDITQYEGVVANQKKTYIGSHFEMLYRSTASYNGSGNGRVRVIIAGFEGYADLMQMDLVPMVYIENKLPITLGGNTYDINYETPFTFITPEQTRFTVSGSELLFQRWSFYNGEVKNNMPIGLKADWMQEGAAYYSYDFTNYYSDRNCTELAGIYYNYYQYLPLRSRTNITAAQLDAYLARKQSSSLMLNAGGTFINAQNTYGVNALIVYSIGCLESAYGTSTIAQRTNNLFGINAVDADPSQATTFGSVADCVNDMSGWFLRKYMDITDWRFFGTHIGNKGSGFNVQYASDPYWGIKIASIAYDIDKSAGLVDYQYYTYGKINDYNVAIRSSADAMASTWYFSAYGATYQKDYTVIFNRTKNGHMEIPTSNPIQNGAVNTESKVRVPYDFLVSLGYIDEAKVTVLNNSRYNALGLPNPITGTLYPEFMIDGNIMNLSAFDIDPTGLRISGYAFNRGLASRTLDSLSHTLVVKNIATDEEILYPLADGALDDSINALHPIKDLAFGGSTFDARDIDLRLLGSGEYEVMLRVAQPGYMDYYDLPINLDTIPDTTGVASSLTFSGKDAKLYLLVKNRIEGSLITTVDQFSWGTEENSDKLRLRGVAAIIGKDHNKRENIKQKLIIKDVSNDETHEYALDTYNNEELGTYYYSLLDGSNYYYVWFDQCLDVSNLMIGDYQFYLDVELLSDDGLITYHGRKPLRHTISGYIPEIKTIGQKTYEINKNYKFLSRYELTVVDGMANELVKINRPTQRLTVFYLEELLTKDAKLALSGFMYMFNTPHDETQKPDYRLHLIQQGQVVNEYQLETNTGLYDITPYISKTMKYDYAWFSNSGIDLMSLDNGVYDLFISESCGDYYDILQMYDGYDRLEESFTYENRVYSIKFNNSYSKKLILEISNAE